MPNNPSSLQARRDAMVQEKMTELGLKYSCDMDPADWMSMCEEAKDACLSDLLRQLDELGRALAERDARIASLESTIRWALGEGEDFPDRPEKVEGKPHPLFWWRTELRARAALKGGQP